MRHGFWRSYCRLLAVQGAWNYERMTGIGLGYAAQPLLEDLRTADPARHAEAQVRSVEYFNSHPYLAGLALGAQVRAEDEAAPGELVVRLRTALTSPLGSLGDQFFWAGLVPAVMGSLILALVLGAPPAAVWVAVGGYAAVRLWTGFWALRTGLATGPQIGAVVGHSWLSRWAPGVGSAAGFILGVTLPVAAGHLLEGFGTRDLSFGLLTAALGLVGGIVFGPRLNSVRFGLVTLLGGFLFWGLR
ncbi:MAG: PTS system mannose/fructose/sorbose family transporter subunit IID [Gemmatimonadota bacterium]|nr:PTS system mannose/fructose/sorbose family transporter subunit IID [Gemmatimonadota bacterium]MDH5283861.1 PTS system mannose/fructose/sorbose family transporter subunit IID [Gemmatimonadota bacterium]